MNIHALTLEIHTNTKKNWLIYLGLLGLYLPTLQTLVDKVWTQSDQAHGPLILLIVIYLFWIKRISLSFRHNDQSNTIGWVIFSFGLIAYIVGRSQGLITLEAASAILIVSALLMLHHGMRALSHYWFPLFFMVFMVPLPGSFLDFITVPMKLAVSTVAEQCLYWLGFPVARQGVIIQIGQYQLFVANACAGMHTLISLEALGLLYITLVKRASFVRNAVLGLLIIPISFTANVLRVITLVLVTYYFGDEVAQGFIHSFASVFLFAVALLLIIVTDAMIQRLIKRKHDG